jgi:hypothetical protein
MLNLISQFYFNYGRHIPEQINRKQDGVILQYCAITVLINSYSRRAGE